MKMPYQTSDFPEICFLLERKHQLREVLRDNPRRAVFLFEDTPQLRADVDRLFAGKAKVNPLDFWAAERRCKALLYNSREL